MAAPPELKILVCGKTGVGKSTLCNSLLGKDMCVVRHPGQAGVGLDPCTKTTELVTLNLPSMVVKFFDSPGLQDGSVKDNKAYVMDMFRKCRDVGLVLYCIDMSQTRMPEELESTGVRAFGLMTKQFGEQIWERTVFVLTKANRIFHPSHLQTIREKVEYDRNIYHNFIEKTRSVLEKVGVSERIRAGIDVRTVAVGYRDDHDTPGRKIYFASENSFATAESDRRDFIPELWVTCLEAVSATSMILFLEATTDEGSRIIPNLTTAHGEQFSEQVHRAALTARHTVSRNPPSVETFVLDSNQEKRAAKAIRTKLLIIAGTAGGGTGAVVGLTGGILVATQVAAAAATSATAGAVVGGPIGLLLGAFAGVTVGVIGGFVAHLIKEEMKSRNENVEADVDDNTDDVPDIN